MGLAYVAGTVSDPRGKRARVNILGDGGATYTMLPLQVRRAIGFKPKDSGKCVLVVGTEVERGVSECLISLTRGEKHTPAMLGRKSMRHYWEW